MTPPAPSWPSPGGVTARSPASTGARPASTSWASGGSGSASRPSIIVLGIISIVLRGGLNLGIEFKGGTEWTIAAPGVTQTEAVNALKGTGVIDPTVELLGTGSKQTLNVQSDLNRLSQAQQDAVSKNVAEGAARGDRPPTRRTSAPTTTTTTAKPTTTTTAKAGGRGRRRRRRPPRRTGQRRAQDARPTRSASPPSARRGARPSPTRRSRR